MSKYIRNIGPKLQRTTTHSKSITDNSNFYHIQKIIIIIDLTCLGLNINDIWSFASLSTRSYASSKEYISNFLIRLDKEANSPRTRSMSQN